MAELIVEIWIEESGDAISAGAAIVSEQNDRVRASVSPNAVRVHSYKATSYLDHAQKFYGFQGWGKYEPSAVFEDHFYTAAEAEEQRQYLAVRNVSFST
jgi:hypothetical protein